MAGKHWEHLVPEVVAVSVVSLNCSTGISSGEHMLISYYFYTSKLVKLGTPILITSCYNWPWHISFLSQTFGIKSPTYHLLHSSGFEVQVAALSCCTEFSLMWVNQGYRTSRGQFCANWTNAINIFVKHESSNFHKICAEAFSLNKDLLCGTVISANKSFKENCAGAFSSNKDCAVAPSSQQTRC